MVCQGTIDDLEQFLEKYSKVLHPNHYHLVTCKHNLMQVRLHPSSFIPYLAQMYGRTEGYLIQDMEEDQLERKKELCLEHLAVLNILDPDQIRLMIYSAAAHFELHLPLLQVKAMASFPPLSQVAKRAWESGKMATEEFREALKQPHLHLQVVRCQQ